MSSIIETTADKNRRNMYVYASMEYNSNIFDKSSVRKVMENLLVISKAITIATKTQMTCDIDPLSEEHKQQLLIEWNDTECDWWPKEDGFMPASNSKCTVHQLFEDQVRRVP